MKKLFLVVTVLVLLSSCTGDYPVDIDSLPKQQYIYFLTDTINTRSRETETYYARMNTDGTNRRYLTRLWSGMTTALFSPNRKKVLLGYQIMNINGTDRKFLAEGNGFAWSPNSIYVAYWNYDSLRIVNVYTLESSLVGTGKYFEKAVWSRDSRSLYYIKRDSAIASVRSDGSGDKILLKAVPGSEIDYISDITSSPYADLILFTFKNGITGQAGIGSIKPDGSQLKTASADKYFAFYDWSPDGKRILALGYYTTIAGLAEIDTETLLVKDLVRYDKKGIFAPAYSPDGKKITFTRGETEYLSWYDRSRLFMINSDGTGFKALTSDTLKDTTPSDRYSGWSK